MAVGGKRPILALEIDVDEAFFHCAKAFLRSDASAEQLENHYAEESMRKIPY
jgi:hypothetical protein